MSVAELVRPEIRALKSYVPAPPHPHVIRLNANESAAAGNGLHRYPEFGPGQLHTRLAHHFSVPESNLLVTRGSSEAIDLLLRAFCRAGVDNVVISPPTFEMYRVYADIQGATAISVPLAPASDFRLDAGEILDACTAESKLIFVCSPNNPSGTLVPAEVIEEIVVARQKQSVVVVDEAYLEFSQAPSVAESIRRFDNLVVLRTLSKAQRLAGARCGVAIARAPVISILGSILSPFAISTPTVDCVLEALSDDGLRQAAAAVATTIAERERLATLLGRLGSVERCWRSHANFLLVRFRDIDLVHRRLRAANIVVREFGQQEALNNCVRITVGTAVENDALLKALS